MTEPDKIIAVSDTGPLISAFQCGRTDLFRRYFSRIYITASELTELDGHGWADEIRGLIREGLVKVAKELNEEEKKQAELIARNIAAHPGSGDPDWHSHFPEAEAMVLMLQKKNLMIDQIILDEKAARDTAQKQGLSMTGFPGILGRAGADGIVTKNDIRQLLKICQQQGTHYSNKLIELLAQTYGR